MVARRIGREDIGMMAAAQYLNYASAAFAISAAALWFVSALVKTPSSFPIAVDISAATWDGSVGGTGYCPDLSNLGYALKRQSRWSAYAATCAGIAAILAAIPLILGAGSN
jgi:hypothetical protein